jgi:predicted amidophosphoribosyltransferase
VNPALCPACGQTLPEKRGRRCSVCGQPIRGHDKFYFLGSMVQHRDCGNPTLYAEPDPPQARLIIEEETHVEPSGSTEG